MLLAEKIFLNGFVDFDRAQAAQGLGAAVRVAQHWGFRLVVAFAAAVALFVYVRGGQSIRTIDALGRAAPFRVSLMLGHLLLIAALAPLSYVLYRHTTSDLSLAAVVLLWSLVGFAAVVAALRAMAPLALWVEAVRGLGLRAIWPYAALAAAAGTGAMQLTQMLWEPTAALTFYLVQHLLAPLVPELRADSVSLILSTNRFAVQVAEVCSGLEGVGLILAFSGAWLIYFRREYVFPRALLLIPVGVAAIFALNVVRIAALVLIGNAGFPDVAIYGFHSQAGWIAFIAVACGLVLLSRRSVWLNRSAAAENAGVAETRNPTAPYLMPLLAILAAGAVSRAMSGGFEYSYPLRVIAGLALLTYYRRELAAIDWRFSWRGVAVGAAVFVMWILAARYLASPSAMPDQLALLSPPARALWVASRIAGAVLTVPIAEELAYRGYLIRRLMNSDFESVSYRAIRWPAWLAASVLFGCAHGDFWLPGTLAGLGFGLVVIRRSSLGEAVAAHATCNALIAVCVLAGGQWQLW